MSPGPEGSISRREFFMAMGGVAFGTFGGMAITGDRKDALFGPKLILEDMARICDTSLYSSASRLERTPGLLPEAEAAWLTPSSVIQEPIIKPISWSRPLWDMDLPDELKPYYIYTTILQRASSPRLLPVLSILNYTPLGGFDSVPEPEWVLFPDQTMAGELFQFSTEENFESGVLSISWIAYTHRYVQVSEPNLLSYTLKPRDSDQIVSDKVYSPFQTVFIVQNIIIKSLPTDYPPFSPSGPFESA